MAVKKSMAGTRENESDVTDDATEKQPQTTPRKSTPDEKAKARTTRNKSFWAGQEKSRTE